MLRMALYSAALSYTLRILQESSRITTTSEIRLVKKMVMSLYPLPNLEDVPDDIDTSLESKDSLSM